MAHPPTRPAAARAARRALLVVLVVAATLVAVARTQPAVAAAPIWEAATLFPGGVTDLEVFAGKPRMIAGNGTADYTACDADCAQPDNWTHTSFDPDGGGGIADLAIDTQGRPRIFYIAPDGSFRYAACDTACTSPANWQHAVLDHDTRFSANTVSLALDSQGRPRAVYGAARPAGGDSWRNELMHAACDTGCTDAANWSKVNLGADNFRGEVSLALDTQDRAHLVYTRSADGNLNAIRYARCDANCVTRASWRTVTVPDPWDESKNATVAVDGDAVHVAYVHIEGLVTITDVPLSYATCPAACDNAANWRPGITVDDTTYAGAGVPQIALANGKPRIAYNECENCVSQSEVVRVHYAWCDTACHAAANWTHELPTVTGDYTEAIGSGLAFDGDRPRLAFFD